MRYRYLGIQKALKDLHGDLEVIRILVTLRTSKKFSLSLEFYEGAVFDNHQEK